jgi:hypothetical protein
LGGKRFLEPQYEAAANASHCADQRYKRIICHHEHNPMHTST